MSGFGEGERRTDDRRRGAGFVRAVCGGKPTFWGHFRHDCFCRGISSETILGAF